MNLVSFFPTNTRKPINSMDKLFDGFFRDDFPVSFRHGVSQKSPAVNIAESEDNYRIEVAAPGLAKEDFELKVEQDMLMVSAKKEVKDEESKERYTRKEFSFFEFKRNFHLPETVATDGIAANYENGILYITLAKKEEAKPQPAKVIEIG